MTMVSSVSKENEDQEMWGFGGDVREKGREGMNLLYYPCWALVAWMNISGRNECVLLLTHD